MQKSETVLRNTVATGDAARTGATLRIASMLASATEIVVALGLEDSLVAISHECDFPPQVLDRPRVSRPRFDPAGLDSGDIDRAVRQAMLEHGSVYEVDAARLSAQQPTLVLTQAVCEVCAVPTPGVREVVARHHIGATVLSLDAHTLADVLDSIASVGRAAGVPERAAALVAALRERVDRVRREVAGLACPRVLAIEWLDPPFVPGHWVPEMIEVAGGSNLAGRTGERSQQTSWEALEGLDPDVLIVMPCGYGLAASIADADRFAQELRRSASRAIDAGRAWVVDGSSWFNRSGPRIAGGIEILSRILHPELGLPAAGTACRWPLAQERGGEIA
jgi:iron complex transport system substrate-binding protein